MASTSDLARRYFAALDAHDLDEALALWEPGSIDRLVGSQELVAPHGVRAYFADVFAAFPDFRLTVDELTTYRDRTAVRWTATGTFAGPGWFDGLAPNGGRVELQGCDVIRVRGEKIVGNDAYMDSGALARQLGFLPEAGSRAQERLAAVANFATRVRRALHGDSPPELIADGVWVLRGGFPGRTMNVYLIRDGEGVTVFDAGIAAMGASLRAAAATLGGVTRVVLGHADADHRGAAPALAAPVLCHGRELTAARSSSALRSYWDLRRLPPVVRQAYGRVLLPAWDGGAVQVADTLSEGDEVAGFRVVELPGHAPGLIGLFREADRTALVSDCLYTIDPVTTVKGGPRIPHPAFNEDSLEARRSILKLADLAPAVVWAGHANPVTGDVTGQLREAAAAVT